MANADLAVAETVGLAEAAAADPGGDAPLPPAAVLNMADLDTMVNWVQGRRVQDVEFNGRTIGQLHPFDDVVYWCAVVCHKHSRAGVRCSRMRTWKVN